MTCCLLVLRMWLNKAFRVVEDVVRQTPARQGLVNSKMEADRENRLLPYIKKGNV